MTRTLFVVLPAMVFLVACEPKPQLCDIAQSSCQEEIYLTDLRLRGDGFDPFAGVPPIRTIDEDTFREELQAEAAQAATAQEKNPTPWVDAALTLLHLVPVSTADPQSTSIDNQVALTAAYYSPDTRDVTVVSHPAQAADPNAEFGNMVVLAHELVHALQDHELDLISDVGSADAYFSYKALIEGDASLYDYLFAEKALPQGLHLRYPNPLAYFTQMRKDNLSDDPSVENNFASLGPPFYAALRWLVYPLGGTWIAERWQKGGNAALRHAYGKAPTRSLDFLLASGTPAPPTKEILCQPLVPAEFMKQNRPYALDSFGAITFYALLMALGVPSSDAVASSLLWRNDLIFVYYNPTTLRTAVAWRFELDSPLPQSVFAAITTSDGPKVLQTGSTLLVTASDDDAFMATWNPTTACR
jgi:hypothetical protein